MSMDELTRQFRVVQDQLAIRELTARYNRAVDDVQSDEFAGTFTEDGEFWIGRDGRVVAGREAIARMSRAGGYGRVHMTFDSIVEVDGDSATQLCNALIGKRSAGREPGSSHWTTTGRYEDELVRTAEGWRFRKRIWLEDAEITDRADYS